MGLEVSYPKQIVESITHFGVIYRLFIIIVLWKGDQRCHPEQFLERTLMRFSEFYGLYNLWIVHVNEARVDVGGRSVDRNSVDGDICVVDE